MGIDPTTCRMLSDRSTIWATSPIGDGCNFDRSVHIDPTFHGTRRSYYYE